MLGTSSCIPNLSCLIGKAECRVCQDALVAGSRNRRGNTSILIRYSSTAQKLKNILIDCGKTFYDSVLKNLIPNIDMRNSSIALEGVVLTHAHADACFGLDDLRHWTLHSTIQSSINLFIDTTAFEAVSETFPYLVDRNLATGGGEVSKLNITIFEPGSTLEISDLALHSIPIHHGYRYNNGDAENQPFIALGYRFEDVAYISDVSFVPQRSMEALRGTKVLIIDSLRPSELYSSHFSFDDALKVIVQLMPLYVFLVGMNHSWDERTSNDVIVSKKRLYPQLDQVGIFLAFDGLVLRFNYLENGLDKN